MLREIETETGQSSTVPIAVLTPKQLEVFLQSEFKRLAQEAGVKGARIHVERAIAADYEQVLREVAAWLFSGEGTRRMTRQRAVSGEFRSGNCTKYC